MGVIINGSLNVNNTGTIINANSATSISTGPYSRINKNGSININTDPRFGVPYPVNFEVTTILGPIISVSIGGGPQYIIKQGTFPVTYLTSLFGHHFGGTSITISEIGNATVYVAVNDLPIIGGGTCSEPKTDTFTINYTFTEQDFILIYGNDCGA